MRTTGGKPAAREVRHIAWGFEDPRAAALARVDTLTARGQLSPSLPRSRPVTGLGAKQEFAELGAVTASRDDEHCSHARRGVNWTRALLLHFVRSERRRCVCAGASLHAIPRALAAHVSAPA
jgi:hypothetical protein